MLFFNNLHQINSKIPYVIRANISQLVIQLIKISQMYNFNSFIESTLKIEDALNYEP